MQNIPYSHKIMSTQNMHTFENHNIKITNQKKTNKDLPFVSMDSL